MPWIVIIKLHSYDNQLLHVYHTYYNQQVHFWIGGGWGFASINHGYKSKKTFSFENELKAIKNPRVMPISGL